MHGPLCYAEKTVMPVGGAQTRGEFQWPNFVCFWGLEVLQTEVQIGTVPLYHREGPRGGCNLSDRTGIVF